MLFKLLHILGVLTSVSATYRDSHEGLQEEGLESIKLNPKMLDNRNQLKRIIKYLNGHDDYERTENNKLVSFVNKDTDVDNNIVNEEEARIMAALSLLQKNYNNLLRQGKEEKKPRLLYINNPEVLEEYKSNLRGFFPWSSSDSADYDSNEEITSDEISGHRKFDVIAPGKSKTADKRSHSRSKHKSRATKGSNEPELRNNKNNPQKGRFKITRDKRIPQIIEGNRPKIEKKEKLDDLDVSNLMFDKKDKMAVNVAKEIPKTREAPIIPKFTENKYDLRDKVDYYKNKKPVEEVLLNKRGGKNGQSLGRTFIPYIATKTVYEDD